MQLHALQLKAMNSRAATPPLQDIQPLQTPTTSNGMTCFLCRPLPTLLVNQDIKSNMGFQQCHAHQHNNETCLHTDMSIQSISQDGHRPIVNTHKQVLQYARNELKQITVMHAHDFPAAKPDIYFLFVCVNLQVPVLFCVVTNTLTCPSIHPVSLFRLVCWMPSVTSTHHNSLSRSDTHFTVTSIAHCFVLCVCLYDRLGVWVRHA